MKSQLQFQSCCVLNNIIHRHAIWVVYFSQGLTEEAEAVMYIYICVYIHIYMAGICYRDLTYTIVEVGKVGYVRMLSLHLMLVYRAGSHKGKITSMLEAISSRQTP